MVAAGVLALAGSSTYREHRDARPAVEHDFLTPVAGKRAGFEHDRPQGLALRRKAADELGQLRSQLLLPRLGLSAGAGLESKAPRRRRAQSTRENHGIESAILNALGDSRERADVRGRFLSLGSERQGPQRRQGRDDPREFTPRHFSHARQYTAGHRRLAPST